MEFQEFIFEKDEKLEVQASFFLGYLGYRTQKEIEQLEEDMSHLPKSIKVVLMYIIVGGTIAPIPGGSLITPLSLSLIMYLKKEKIHDWVNEQIIKLQIR